MYGDDIVFESDYEQCYGRPEPSPAKVAADKAKLAEFLAEAEAIKASTIERRRALSLALREYAESDLTNYCYNRDGIESLVDEIVDAADLQHWDLGESRCWLPSNFGC